MRPLASAALLVLLPLTSFAEPSARAEGLVIRIDPGYLDWRLNAARIASAANVSETEVKNDFVDQTKDGPSGALEFGYNIKGHVTIALSLMGTAWDATNSNRGGGAFGGLTLAWHPIEIFSGLRDRPYDFSLFAGGGYAVAGEIRAMDGIYLQYGARAEVYVARWLSVGASIRYVDLRYSRYVFDWNANDANPIASGSYGSALMPSVTLALHGS